MRELNTLAVAHYERAIRPRRAISGTAIGQPDEVTAWSNSPPRCSGSEFRIRHSPSFSSGRAAAGARGGAPRSRDELQPLRETPKRSALPARDRDQPVAQGAANASSYLDSCDWNAVDRWSEAFLALQGEASTNRGRNDYASVASRTFPTGAERAAVYRAQGLRDGAGATGRRARPRCERGQAEGPPPLLVRLLQ